MVTMTLDFKISINQWKICRGQGRGQGEWGNGDVAKCMKWRKTQVNPFWTQINADTILVILTSAFLS